MKTIINRHLNLNLDLSFLSISLLCVTFAACEQPDDRTGDDVQAAEAVAALTDQDDMPKPPPVGWCPTCTLVGPQLSMRIDPAPEICPVYSRKTVLLSTAYGSRIVLGYGCGTQANFAVPTNFLGTPPSSVTITVNGHSETIQAVQP